MAQVAHTGSFCPILGSCAALEGSLTREKGEAAEDQETNSL